MALRVCLTFDEPDNASSTAKILDLLDEYNISSTFFVKAKTAEEFPDYTSDIAMKHEVACHSYDHEVMTTYNYHAQKEIIRMSYEIISDVVGKKPIGWRSPFFKSDHITYKAENGFRYVSDGNVNLLHPLIDVLFNPFIGNVAKIFFAPKKRGLSFKLPPNMVPMIFDIHIQDSVITEMRSFGPDDSYMYKIINISTEKVMDVWKRSIDLAIEWNGGICILCLHPWVEAENERFNTLRKFIEYSIEKNAMFSRLDSLSGGDIQ